jgi:AcrR family transcriptional regulator
MVRTADKPKESLVARKQRRIRQELALTALELFTEKGYDETTVEEIVERVEISMSTFYRFFPSKSDLILELHRIGSKDLIDAIAERPPEEPLADALDAAILKQRDDLEQDLVALRHFQALVAKYPELRGRLLTAQYDLRDLMAAAIAPRLGSASEDLHSQVVAMAILSTTHVALDLWSNTSGAERPVDVVRAAYRCLVPLFTPLA